MEKKKKAENAQKETLAEKIDPVRYGWNGNINNRQNDFWRGILTITKHVQFIDQLLYARKKPHTLTLFERAIQSAIELPSSFGE